MPTEAKKKPEVIASAPVAAPVAAPAVDVAAIAAQAVAAETTRCAQIRAYAQPHAAVDGIDALALTAQGDPAVTAADFGLQVLAHLGKHSGDPVGSGIQSVPGGDSRDKFITGAEAAIMMRAGQLSMTDKAVQGNEFNGMRLVEIARHAGKLAGIDTGGTVEAMLKSVMAAGNHSSSDFPLILENIANKTMLRGWEESDESYREWVNNGTLPDFKVSKRVDLNLFGNLPTVPEGGEYSYGTIGERGESVVLLKIGRLFSITWEAIINDDMDAFTKIPDRMIRAADRTVGGMVYAQLTTNPLMSDGVPLFDAAHNNLLTGSALDTAGVSGMRTAMGLQKDADGIAETGLNIRMARLIVPLALEDQAELVRGNPTVVGGDAGDTSNTNVMRNRFEVTADARLDDDDPAAWYGAAGSNMDLIEVSTLAGQSMPTMTREDGFNVDGMTLKIRHAVGVKALDYRTFQKNPGA